ncbi:MAG: YgfZ/GcvT domain-containing protein [Ilumatobacteraceae bacterium]
MAIAARDEVTVSGVDALTYLQGQVSQDLLALAVGEERWTFLLAPNGRVEVLARIRRTADDTFLFDTEAGFGDRLAARLACFKIRVKVDIGPVVASATPPPFGDDAARVEAGWPAMGAEIVPGETIPAETGITVVAVDFKKGCYPGQELVERMDSRGADAPRRLRILDVGDDARPGDPIELDGKAVGVLTTVAGRRALGFVKRGVELGTALR